MRISLTFACLRLTRLLADGFYILTHPAPAIPGRLPTVGTPNVIKQIIETPITVPDATLEGPKSGIKLAFGTNRQSFVLSVYRPLTPSQSPASSSTRTSTRTPPRARARRSTADQASSATATPPTVRLSVRAVPRALLTPPRAACAFLEFHEPLAAWENPATLGASKDDTLLASGELYNNYTKTDVYYHTPAQ